MFKRCGVHSIAWVLLVIGGINWGLVGLGWFMESNWNIVNILLNSWPVAEAIVYLLVGISAVASLFGHSCKACRVSGSSMGSSSM